MAIIVIWHIQKKKEGIFIENKILELKNLTETEDVKILKEILKDTLHLDIKGIKYEKNLKLENISEYEFELLKVKAILSSGEELEMYLKIIKNSKLKESIFCYWTAIYEEEMEKHQKDEDSCIIVNKVVISELENQKYQKKMFLNIENNRTQILETGTEINFIDIIEYINEYKTDINKYERLYNYLGKDSENVLLVGIKIERK